MATETLNNPEVDDFESDIHFKPVISLPLIEQVTLEEDELVLTQLRAKLFRFDTSESPSTWKERGNGEIKLLHNTIKNTVRVVMRRDKTLKICANHFITPSMKLHRPPNAKKAWWIWTAPADFADEISKSEIFAIKFSSEENANLWKENFEQGQNIIQNENLNTNDEKESESSINESSVSDSESEEVYEDATDETNSASKITLLKCINNLDLNK